MDRGKYIQECVCVSHPPRFLKEVVFPSGQLRNLCLCHVKWALWLCPQSPVIGLLGTLVVLSAKWRLFDWPSCIVGCDQSPHTVSVSLEEKYLPGIYWLLLNGL